MAGPLAPKNVIIRLTEEQYQKARQCSRLTGDPVTVIARAALVEKIESIQKKKEEDAAKNQNKRQRSFVPEVRDDWSESKDSGVRAVAGDALKDDE